MMRMDPIFAALDANHDNVISAEEINNAAAALRTLDKNGDGKLTEDEIRPNFGARGGGRPE
jgi:Ca2+-binding EF-hand superfamily protein